MTKNKYKIIHTLIFTFFLVLLPVPSYAGDKTMPILFKTFGQSNTETLNSDSVVLDSIAINNFDALIEGTDLTVYKDDAVRIEGRSTPGSKIIVSFGNTKIETIADYGGSWFVLFSITNMEEGKYIVNAQASNSNQPTLLVNLIVGQGNRILEPTLRSNTEEKNQDILIYIGIALVSLILGWFAHVLFERINHKRGISKK